MKYLLVCYMDSLPLQSKEFDTREEAEKVASEISREDFWESVIVYEVES